MSINLIRSLTIYMGDGERCRSFNIVLHTKDTRTRTRTHKSESLNNKQMITSIAHRMNRSELRILSPFSFHSECIYTYIYISVQTTVPYSGRMVKNLTHSIYIYVTIHVMTLISLCLLFSAVFISSGNFILCCN